jgi:ATP-dependent Lon protease
MTDVIHRAVPTLPIKNSVLFPYLIMPLAVGRPRSVAAVEAALAKEDKLIAVFAQKGPSIEEPSLDDCYSIGRWAAPRTCCKWLSKASSA